MSTGIDLDLPQVPLAHISDTHLGHEAYPALSQRGFNQRGQDIVRALDNCVRDVLAWDPPLVIHSGDVFDRSTTPTRYMLEMRRQLSRLASLRPNGTRRQIVVIAGNHDQPYSRKEPCSLELFAGLPGVHIVTAGYQVLAFDKQVDAGEADDRLRDVMVHAIPHDDLKTLNFDEVQPVEGCTNILTAHGVAGGSELFVRALGREYPIPTDVLSRDWDYVALGHWHKQGPVGLRAASGGEQQNSRVWYAGSPENITFRDLKDNGQRRGYLQVNVIPGQMPEVARKNLPIRPMFRLPVLDATGMKPEQIAAALKERIAAAKIRGAVVGQVVEGVTRDVWALVDIASVRAAATDALHYDGPTVRYTSPVRATGDSAEPRSALGDLGTKLVEQARRLGFGDEVLDLARRLLGSALDDAVPESTAEAAPPQKA